MKVNIITITNGAAWSIEFYTNGGYFDTRKKSLETRSEVKCVKLAFVGLKLDRPQLQNWLLFLEHNWPTPKSENSNVVGLPVPMGCDCVCASACVFSSPSDFE